MTNTTRSVNSSQLAMMPAKTGGDQMNTETRSPHEEVEKARQYFRSIGIAKYSINGLDEDTSLLSFIREKHSFRFALVRDPHSRSKNLVSRLFKIDIWEPRIPMGYSYSAGFVFDYMGDNPIKKALTLAEIVFQGKYKGRIMKEKSCYEQISFRLVNPAVNLADPLPEDKKEVLRKHNFKQIKT